MVQMEEDFICLRCGACCRTFSTQIRYCINPKEDNWDDLDKYFKKIILTFNANSQNENVFPYRRNRKDFYLNPEKEYFFIPTKLEYLVSVLSSSFKLGNISETSKIFNILLDYSSTIPANECLFLTLKNGLPSCTINKTHPEMCDNYPKGKGYVCLNQPDRHFTKTYLNHKIEKFRNEIEILKSVVPYFTEHNLEKSFDLIVFLIDFGFFEYAKVEKFFIMNGWELMDFKYAVKDLLRFGLIFSYIKDGVKILECISSTSLKKQIEKAFFKKNRRKTSEEKNI